MENKIALCLITNFFLDKDYIEEYCKYYFNLGIDIIYLMDDAKGQDYLLSSIPYVKRQINNGKIVYLPCYDHPSQIGLYDKFYYQHKEEFDWCCFFDSDEFLVLHNHSNIKDFLNDKTLNFNENADSITICWKLYGDSGFIHKQNKSVFDTFTTVSKNNNAYGNNIETKTIVRGKLSKVRFTIGHFCLCNDNVKRTVFCDGTPYDRNSPFHIINYDIASLNHYVTKSTEEFLRRKSIGRLDIPNRKPLDCLKEFKETYFKINEWSQEKEDMFQNKIKELSSNIPENNKLKLYCTYYKDIQENLINKNIPYIIPYNTNCDEFDTNVLNPFWSEFIVIKNIWKKGKSSDYIGFEQYDTHFPYDKIENILSNNKILFFGKMNLPNNIYEHYKVCHSNKDLDLVLNILDETYGKDNKYTNYLKTSKVLYYKSCFILTWEQFDNLCNFMFDILDKLDKKLHLNYDPQRYEAYINNKVANNIYTHPKNDIYLYQRRMFGYLGERLISAWIYNNFTEEEIYFVRGGNKLLTKSNNDKSVVRKRFDSIKKILGI